jgi:hypothetical protein
MKDVMGRKLFRQRNARNKLNAMGGIMASSPELMQTVQKFADGSGPQGVQARRPNMFANFSTTIRHCVRSRKTESHGVRDIHAIRSI